MQSSKVSFIVYFTVKLFQLSTARGLQRLAVQFALVNQVTFSIDILQI